MSQGEVVAEIVSEPTRPELWAIVYYSADEKRWIVFSNTDREVLLVQLDEGDTLIRIPGSAPRPAPAEVEMRRQVAEARWLLENLQSRWDTTEQVDGWLSRRNKFLDSTGGRS